MSNTKKPKNNSQAEYRRTTFPSAQYWNLNYTERYSSGAEKDFKTIVFAKSYLLAVHILKTRLQEDDSTIKVKALQGFMFHKGYHSNSNGRLGIKEWEQIRSSSFPNENNVLFKIEIPRAEGKTNRFNRTDLTLLKSIGFKKGESNWATRNRKGKTLPIEERAHKIWKGRWVEWDPSLRQAAKNKLIEALVKSGNNRTHTAKYLGIQRNCLYKLFLKFSEVDWKSDYPPPSPPRPHSGYKRAQSETLLRDMVPKLDEALSKSGGRRAKAAESLNLSPSVFSKLLRSTKDKIDWYSKYPSKFANKKYVKKS